MEDTKELTVEVDLSLSEIQQLLKNNGYNIIKIYDINDVYLVDKNYKDLSDKLELLNHCVILRKLENENLLIHKYKVYNDKKEIINEQSISINIDSISKTKQFFESINYEELIKVDDHLIIYANDEEEFALQVVNNKYIYIEIEENRKLNKKYKNLDEMKSIIIKNNIPIKNNDYFAKKALDVLKERDD